MKTISIIPARGGSKGIRLKNIAVLNNRSLLSYTVNASLGSRFIDRTIVSTDNKKIANEAIKLGTEVIKRPKKLANDVARIEPTIKQVLNFLKENENYEPDTIILLQNTSPLRTKQHIDNAFQFFKKRKYDSVLTGFISHNLFWKSDNKKVKPLNYNPLNRPNRQNMKKQFVENGAIYITKFKNFKRTNCRISGHIGLYEMPEQDSIQIDSKLDLLVAEHVLKRRKRK